MRPVRRREFALVAADLDLVPLLAVLVDAEDADVADVVVAAGIHAAGDVEVELADVVQVVEVVEALAGSPAATGIDLALASEQKSPPGQAMMLVSRPMFGVARPSARSLLPQRRAGRLAHVGEDQVLLVRDAQLAEGVAVGELGDARPSGRR